MKTRLLCGLLVCLALATNLCAGPRDAQWAKVDQARKKGLPVTAIAELEPIITASLADHAYAEAIKAIARKIALEGDIQGRKPEERIVRMQATLETVPAAMKPVMEAILADWYWQFFQQNRWRFMQRTETNGAPGPDLQTWDLKQILAEIDRHFTSALADETVLQATPVADFDELLPRGSMPDHYRPTLFDFLAHEALQFYQAGENAGFHAEDNFEIDSAGPIFADTTEFSHWSPTTTDETAPALKAVHLYQKLLRFHLADSDRTAFYEADLDRMNYGANVAVGEDKDGRYEAALERFIAATAAHEISSRALAALAVRRYEHKEFAQAHELAARGLAAFPGSPGGALCFNLIQQIEAKSAQLNTERVWNAPWPTLDVTYRNVTKVYFRAIPVDFADHLARSRWSFMPRDPEERQRLLTTTPALAWTADLPPTRDYVTRTEKIPAPDSLKPGFYFIIASHDPIFRETDNQLGIAAIWVSDLALVLRVQYDRAAQSGLVLHARTGEPIAGATIRFWRRDQQGHFQSIAPTRTDGDGRFRFTAGKEAVLVLAESNGQAISSLQEIGSYEGDAEASTHEQTVFFTDRAIYRPGQSINYKGVSVHHDQNAAKYSVVAGRSLTAVFKDPNGKEIARATHRTNDYGSFAGVFTAPRDRLMGQMTIQVLEETGQASFQVEEYKRPKFQVEIPPPAEAAKLQAPVRLTGKATAYSGAAIGGAKVNWRVERGVRLPPWCWWWQPPATQAIAHGTAVTASDGTFSIEFAADPDRAVPAKNEPVFGFTVHADVIDGTGETRSADRTVQVGYTALQASLAADDWQTPETPVEFTVNTRSLDNDPQSATGTVRIYALKQPAQVARSLLEGGRHWRNRSAEEPPVDPSAPDSWEAGKIAGEKSFQTDATGKTKFAVSLPAGIYRAALETKDRFGRAVTARQTLQVVDPREPHYGVKLANHLSAPKWSVEPGEKFTALWGTGYETGRAFVELECNDQVLQSYWTSADRTLQSITQAVAENMRGGVTLRVTYVRENRAYLTQRVIEVPWSDKELTVKWERFRSKLLPGQKETWSAIVKGPNAQRATVEMVATLYDASLDQYLAHVWPTTFGVFREESPRGNTLLQNTLLGFDTFTNQWGIQRRAVNLKYRQFPADIASAFYGDDAIVLSPFVVASSEGRPSPAQDATLAGARLRTELRDEGASVSVVTQELGKDVFASKLAAIANYTSARGQGEGAAPPKPDLSKVAARKNLNETAFFFPQLVSDRDGVVKLTFTMPEALTQWKFMGFAHDKKLRAGFLTDTAVTAKDLMVEPNPPRFVREGDAIEFTVKVSNQSDQPQTGNVKLTFADAATLRPIDATLGNRVTEQAFDVPARQSRTYSWRVTIPDGTDFLTYKAVGATAKISDGEEGFLPVLSRRVLVTESLPLPIRGPGTKQFEFKQLLDSGQSDTLRSQSLTVQMVSQPAWYAVMSLPYLMEYPYECSEQVFNRFYANALARHIAGSDPKIRRVFEVWKNTPALDSPLEKNQDLKSVLLEETPWVQQAKSESEARRHLGLLFHGNRLDEESARALHTLADRQLNEGLWSWFPGGRPSEYISLYITTGFGRLRQLGVEVDPAPALKSLAALDAWMTREHEQILRSAHPERYVPSYLDALYLYGRSFFLKDHPIAKEHQVAVDFFLRQARQFWLQSDSRQSQAQLAIALQRFGDQTTPQAIMKSLKERSVSTDELGMFWRDDEVSWWWYRAPIETQAVMIEAFAEVAHDAKAVEDCKVWLLKQKQTQDWKTTKATADAIYSLLLQGNSLLGSDALVEVALGGETIKPEKVEAGTGFYEQKFVRHEIKPAMGRITVKKTDEGVSWGSVHWQYLEDVAKIAPHTGTPLQLKKTLFVKATTKQGQALKPVTGPLSVGDELVVRLELRSDRDLEYVHLKDQRGSGTEPVNVLSQYKFQDGLAYYESTRDTASHFFIDYLPKGTYVFEYSTRVQLKGNYQTGLAEIQCMYAPEFNSHSESFALEVR